MTESSSQDQTERLTRIREAVRYALPYHAQVAVVNEGQDELLDLEGMRTWPFPLDGRPLLSALGEVRGEGAQFLLVPTTAESLLDRDEGLREHLRECRIVLREPETCTIFAIHPHSDAYQAPDGLPLPPLEMQAYTTGLYDPGYFFKSGLEDAEDTAKVLARSGHSIDSFEAILDFGCGCGRILRHWKDLSASSHGADYNPYIVDWCMRSLTFSSFERTHAGRHLSYADGAFDFIFSFSVFTHFAHDDHDFWLRELRRVLTPSGILLLTVHGSEYVGRLGPEERKKFDAGELVVWNPTYSGSSRCAAYHSERYIREKLAEDFVLVDIAPGAIRTQDAVLLSGDGG